MQATAKVTSDKILGSCNGQLQRIANDVELGIVVFVRRLIQARGLTLQKRDRMWQKRCRALPNCHGTDVRTRPPRAGPLAGSPPVHRVLRRGRQRCSRPAGAVQVLRGFQSFGDILETGRGLRRQAQWIEPLSSP